MLPLTASILTPVTRVSWSGPRFASELNNEPLASTMREGVTSFTSAFGRPAQGYMVCLRPGAFLDLVVAADSDGENALAVIEFDGAGRPTGRRLSYSNSAGEDDPDPAGAGKFSTLTKKGRLGIWTERNDSAAPRYYFFTGVHKLLNRAADDSWHVSRLSAFVDEPDLFHIGWDDSGMPPGGDKDQSQIPDDDFDDVNATVRIRKLKPEPSRARNWRTHLLKNGGVRCRSECVLGQRDRQVSVYRGCGPGCYRKSLQPFACADRNRRV